jgi:hypothetical protein
VTKRDLVAINASTDGEVGGPGRGGQVPKKVRARSAHLSLGAMPWLALVAALGMILVALGNNAARESDSGLQPLFWAGLAVIYAPIAFRLLGAAAERPERIALVLTLGISLFLVKVLRSPLELVQFDEFGWWRATNEVVNTGHTFNDNPLNVATYGFPGLATTTAAISQLTGLSIFHAGLIVIGTARAVLMLALFLFLERVTSSSRGAGIGIAVYACNPSFLYFDAQFGYESLALMIAAALLLAALRWSRLPRLDLSPPTLGLAGVIAALAASLVVTHHMTALAMLAFLVLWTALVVLFARRLTALPNNAGKGPALPAVMLAVAVLIWFVLVAAGVTIEELGGVLSRSFQSLTDLLFGRSSSKQLFSGAGQTEHLAARGLALASIVPFLALIPGGIWMMWRDRLRDPLMWALAAVAVLYPVTLGLRLTAASSETSQRASEFVFVGVAFIAALVSMRWLLESRPRFLATSARGALAVLATICFVGGFIVGELQATRQPGPYLVGAEGRSISPEGVATANFAAEKLPPESRVFTDRNNATLLGSYGGVNPIFGRYGTFSLPRILFSPRFGRADERAIHGQSLAYIVVDHRLSRELPLIGYYVESDEPGAFTRRRPLSPAALEKFTAVPGVSRIYTNGPIDIYDVTALLE